jgi:glycosyltransferase involved in cell wall biosynthesis
MAITRLDGRHTSWQPAASGLRALVRDAVRNGAGTSAPRLRVLHVLESTVAGVARHTLELLQHADRRAVEFDVACPLQRHAAYGDTQFVPCLRNIGVEVHAVPMRRQPGAWDVAAALRLRAVISNRRYDVVHCHSGKGGLLGRLAARSVRTSAGAPVVFYTPHGWPFLAPRRRLIRRAYVLVERALARQTDVVVCLSESERVLAHAARIRPRQADGLVVVPNGVVRRPFVSPAQRASARRELGLPDAAWVVGTVARLARQKGVDILLAAMRELRRECPDARLVVVGDGPERQRLQRLAARLDLEHAVTWAGFRPDASRLQTAFDTLALASLYEGRPYAALDAMSSGIPVVVSDVVGLSDLVADHVTGRLVAPANAPALAVALRDIWQHPAKSYAMARVAYKQAGLWTTPPEMAQATHDLYVAVVRQLYA